MTARCASRAGFVRSRNESGSLKRGQRSPPSRWLGVHVVRHTATAVRNAFEARRSARYPLLRGEGERTAPLLFFGRDGAARPCSTARRRPRSGHRRRLRSDVAPARTRRGRPVCSRDRERERGTAMVREELLAIMDRKHHWAYAAFAGGALSRAQLLVHYRHEYLVYVRDFPALLGSALGVTPPIDDVRAALAENLYEEQT